MKKTEATLVEQQLEEVPWTIRQTLLGIFLTLVPWLSFTLVINILSNHSAPNVPLPPQTDLIDAIIIFLFSCIIEGAFLIAPLYFANRAFRSTTLHTRLAFRALGFRSFQIGRTSLLIVVFLFAILGVDILYQYVITVLHLHLQTNDQLILEQSKNAPLSTYATLIAAVFVAPFCEEVFFRGFVFPGLHGRIPLGGAIVLSAFLFAAAHADIGSFAVLFIIGLALAFLRWRTRSIWPGMLLHMLNNGVAALAIVLAMQGKL